MSDVPFGSLRSRVLVLAPTARDASATRALFAAFPIEIVTCGSVPELCEEARVGAGALLLTDDALTEEGISALSQLLGAQPPWSDLPVLVLTRRDTTSERAIAGLEQLGNVTLLDRPVQVVMLISAVRTALRSRERQYQLREHLAEQERAREALRRADRMKDEFLAMLAHELRNPLAAMVSASAVLRSVGDSPQVLRQQAVIERQSRHTARLLDDLLDVSRITQGRIDLRRQPLDMVRAIRLVAASAQPRMDERGHRFELSLPARSLCVEGDPARLEQILSNLLTNAAKYTPPGGTISLALSREGAMAVVRVKDDGMGISTDLLPRVFDLFTQADRSLDRAEGGVGIGLTMVKRLVEMHAGAVEAHSDGPDRGSEFVVRLPLSKAVGTMKDESKPPNGSVPNPNPNPNPDPNPLHPQPPKRRVLLVEDNPDAAETLADLLQLWGHETRIVHRGEEALEQVEELQPDLLLVDVGLPGIDGYEVASRLRKTGVAGDAKLVALTGYGQSEDRRRSEAAGFDLHLTKPVDPDVLQELLASLH